MKKRPRRCQLLISLSNPAAIIFGVCLIGFLVSLINAIRIEYERQEDDFFVGHGSPAYWDPLLLLAAATGLVIGRWWSILLALLVSLRLIQGYGYISRDAVSYDVPLLSWRAFEEIWHFILAPVPQNIFEIILAITISIYGAWLLGRTIYRRLATSHVGG